jgi:hypothetical protein
MDISFWGAFCFGLVVGWITYRTLRRKEDATTLSDISGVIAAVGGGLVTALFKDEVMFAGYTIGLAGGFFAYLIVYVLLYGKSGADAFMGRP